MKNNISKYLAALALVTAIGFSGCASDPVTTTQSTTTRRLMTEPAPMPVMQPATSVQQTTTSSTVY